MANNFFKLLSTYKTNYEKLIKKNLERVQQVEDDRKDFLSSFKSWIEKYNSYIENTGYKEALEKYLSSFRKVTKSLKSHLDTIHSYYTSNIDGIKTSMQSGLNESYTNAIENHLSNLSDDIDELKDLLSESVATKTGSTTVPKVTISDKDIPLNWYDFIFRGSDNTDYSFYNYYYPTSFNYKNLVEHNNGDPVKVKIKKFVNLNERDNVIESPASVGDYYTKQFFYTIKDNNPNSSNQKTKKTISNEKELMSLLEFYNFLLICRNVEVKRYLGLYDNYNGGFIKELNDSLTIMKNSYLSWKEKMGDDKNKKALEKIGTEDGKKITLDDFIEAFIKNYLWGTNNDSISTINGSIEDFDKDNKTVSIDEINAFLTDKTSSKAKNVMEIFNFIKDFLKDLENYDIDENLNNDEEHENVDWGKISKQQLGELKQKLYPNLKLADGDISDIFSLSGSDVDSGNDNSIYIDLENGIKIYSLYGTKDAEGNKNLLSWDDDNGLGKDPEDGEYLVVGNEESLCFPQPLYYNLSSDALIVNCYLYYLADYSFKDDNLEIKNGAYWDDEKIYNLSQNNIPTYLELSGYTEQFKEAAELASIYNVGTMSEISEKLETAETDVKEAEDKAASLSSAYNSAKNTADSVLSDTTEVITAD